MGRARRTAQATPRPRWPDTFLPPLQLSPADLAQLRQLRQFERDWQTNFEEVFSKRERQMRVRPLVPLAPATPSPWLERYRHEMPAPDAIPAGWPLNDWPIITRVEVPREVPGGAAGAGTRGAGGAGAAWGALRGWAAGAALLAALLLLFRLAERCLHLKLFRPRNRLCDIPPYSSHLDMEATSMLESGTSRGDAPPPYNKATREDPPPPYSECRLYVPVHLSRPGPAPAYSEPPPAPGEDKHSSVEDEREEREGPRAVVEGDAPEAKEAGGGRDQSTKSNQQLV